MGKRPRYNDEFKQEAVNQVVVHGYPVLEVSKRLGISNKSLYDWIKKFSKPTNQRKEEEDLRAENARLKRQLKRAEQERAILKEAAVDSIGHCNTYAIDLICTEVMFEEQEKNLFPRRERLCLRCMEARITIQ